MRSLTKSLALASCLLATAVACSSAEDDSSGDEAAVTAGELGSVFDMNDVSILFPLKGVGAYPSMRVANIADGETKTPAGQGEFLTEKVLSGALDAARAAGLRSGFDGQGLKHPFSDFFDSRLRGLWQIVGMRFDPCAPGFSEAARAANPGAPGKCLIQFRLITQPFREGSSAPDDFTMHLVFNLGVSDLASLPQNPIIQESTVLLAAIKDASLKAGVKTSGQPLGVHPGLEAEAKSGGKAVGNAVIGMMRALLPKTVSRQIAFMGLQGGGPEPWTFFAGQVAGDSFQRIPQLPGHGQALQTLGFIGPGPVVQKSRAPVNTSPLFDIASDKLTPDQRQLAFKVENASTQHFFNTDCISCHTSSALTHDLGLGDKAEISARIKVPKNITGYITKGQSQDSSWNLRNFGYFDDKPTVSGRTASETVEVVQWFNTKVRAPGAGINGPGLDCSAVDDQVWKCFRDGKDSCFKGCAAAPKPGEITSVIPERQPTPAGVDPTSPSAKDDPCLNATVGGAPIIAVTPLPALKSIGATLGGNDSACLSRFLGGAFVSNNGVVVACSNPTSCIVTISNEQGFQPASTSLTGAEAKRFRQFFRVKDNQFFQTRATNGGLQISCKTDSCDIVIATSEVDLQGLDNDNAINPTVRRPGPQD